jgi:hypothetical protein
VTFEQAKTLCKAAPKIFAWVQVCPSQGAYFQVTKTSLVEYLDNVESEDHVFIELGEEGEIYLGRNVRTSED